MRLLPVGNGSQEQGFEPLFDFREASTEDIKKRVWYRVDQQNAYLTSLDQQLDERQFSPERLEQLIALRAQIGDVMSSNSDPLAFEFSKKLVDHWKLADILIRRFTMSNNFLTMPTDELIDFLNVPDEEAHHSYFDTIWYVVSDVRARFEQGTATPQDSLRLEQLEIQANAVLDQPSSIKYGDQLFYFKNLPTAIGHIVQLREDMAA